MSFPGGPSTIPGVPHTCTISSTNSHVDKTGSNATPLGGRAALDLSAAIDLLQSGRYSDCEQLLSALDGKDVGATAQHASAAACLHILRHSGEPGERGGSALSGHPWDPWDVFRTPGSAYLAPAQLRRRYRQLAALVHPDKCALPVADRAFKALGAALDAATRTLGAADNGPPLSRHRSSRCHHCTPSSAADTGAYRQGKHTHSRSGAATGARRPCHDSAGCDGGGDSHSGSSGSSEAGGSGDDLDTAWFWARTAPLFPSTQPGKGDGEEGLWALPLAELRGEVLKRQAHVLNPSGEQQALPPYERQKRLRVARAVLSERLSEVERCRADTAAGFIIG